MSELKTVTRKEKLIKAALTGEKTDAKAITREEKLWEYAAQHGLGSGDLTNELKEKLIEDYSKTEINNLLYSENSYNNFSNNFTAKNINHNLYFIINAKSNSTGSLTINVNSDTILVDKFYYAHKNYFDSIIYPLNILVSKTRKVIINEYSNFIYNENWYDATDNSYETFGMYINTNSQLKDNLKSWEINLVSSDDKFKAISHDNIYTNKKTGVSLSNSKLIYINLYKSNLGINNGDSLDDMKTKFINYIKEHNFYVIIPDVTEKYPINLDIEQELDNIYLETNIEVDGYYCLNDSFLEKIKNLDLYSKKSTILVDDFLTSNYDITNSLLTIFNMYNSKNITIEFSSNKDYFCRPINIPKNVTINGNNSNLFLILNEDDKNSDYFLKLCGPNITIKNLNITNKLNLDFNMDCIIGLKENSPTGCTFRDLNISGFTGNGIKLEHMTYDTIIDHCNCIKNGGNGFKISGTDIFITNCIAASNIYDGFNLSGSEIYINTVKAYFNGLNVINDNNIVVENKTSCGFNVNSAQGVRLINCDSQENANHGFKVINSDCCIVDDFMSDSNGSSDNDINAGIYIENSRNCRFGGIVNNKSYLRRFHTHGGYITGESYGNVINITVESRRYVGYSEIVGVKPFKSLIEDKSGLNNSNIVNTIDESNLNLMNNSRLYTDSDSDGISDYINFENPNNYTGSILHSIDNKNRCQQLNLTANSDEGKQVYYYHKMNCLESDNLNFSIQFKYLNDNITEIEKLYLYLDIIFLDENDNVISNNTKKIKYENIHNEFRTGFISNCLAPKNSKYAKICFGIDNYTGDEVCILFKNLFISKIY